MVSRTVLAAVICAGVVALPVRVDAQEDHDLAKKLNNPISDLVSVPLQFNWEFGYGTDQDMWEICSFPRRIPGVRSGVRGRCYSFRAPAGNGDWGRLPWFSSRAAG
jgi:hypothetical protein